MSTWKVITECLVNGDVPLTLYASQLSNIKVAVARTPGPLVRGNISFITAANSDDGLPHTLEHLTFMGSKKYPYKGFLDLIANRCLASGTNAWTQQDHTAYQLTTVGGKGFLTILPVYLDHLLSPTLTEAQFITEVHHVNGKGEDGGVVYSEMQDYESDMCCIATWKRRELFFPKNNLYRFETGGRLEALRTTCTLEKIRDFHKRFYHVDNMFVTVCGNINHEALLFILSETENMYPPMVSNFERPFQCQMAVYNQAKDAKVMCPSDDQKVGLVQLCWKGPIADMEETRKLHVLGSYLCGTPASPLQLEYIQQKELFASAVYCEVEERCASELVITFVGVPYTKIAVIKQKFFDETLPRLRNLKEFNGVLMDNTLEQMINQQLAKMETKAHRVIFHDIIEQQINGKTADDRLHERLDSVTALYRMRDFSPLVWIGMIEKYFDNNCICIMAYPSENEVKEVSRKEKERVEMRRKDCGEEGLKRYAQKLSEAMEQTMSSKPAKHVLDKFALREMEEFSLFDIRKVNDQSMEIAKLRFPALIHSGPTHFVEAVIVWDTKKISLRSRMWLMLYFNLIFESPAIINCNRCPYVDVAMMYTRDLIGFSANIGVCGNFNRFVSIKLKATPQKYRALTLWLKTFTIGIEFEAERIKVALQKLIADAAEEKRDGESVTNTLLETMIYKKGSNDSIYGLIRLQEFHQEVLRLLEKHPLTVIVELQSLRNALLSSPINIHFVCNAEQFVPTVTEHMTWLCDHSPATLFENGPETCYDSGDVKGTKVVSVGGSESSFLHQAVHFPYKWDDEETLCVKVLAQYMSQTEGPLWRVVRGKGHAYGVGVHVNPDDKYLSFTLYRSAQLDKAYEESKCVVLRELENMDQNGFEAAKSSLISEIIQSEGTVIQAANVSIFRDFRRLPENFTEILCTRISKITMPRAKEVGESILRSLFDDSKCCRAVATHPAKLKGILEAFPGAESVRIDDLILKEGDVEKD